MTKRPDLDFIENVWIPALRSGEYNQTQTRLHDENGYCCLGVACDLVGVTWVPTTYDDSIFSYADIDDNNEYFEAAVLGPSIRNSINIEEGGIELPPGSRYTWRGMWSNMTFIPLSSLNDNGASFTEIADALQFAVDEWRKFDVYN